MNTVDSKLGSERSQSAMKVNSSRNSLMPVSEEDIAGTAQFLSDVVLGRPMAVTASSIVELHEQLKDGVLLCKLVNKIRPGTIRNIGQKDFSFVKMDNISRFLQGARQLGLTDSQLFDTVDLFEAKNMSSVLHTVRVLAAMLSDPDAPFNSGKEQAFTKEDINKSDGSCSKENMHQDIFAAGHGKREGPERAQLYESNYRDVRDIFMITRDDHLHNAGCDTFKEYSFPAKPLDACASQRPPKSPLRPMCNSHPNAHYPRKMSLLEPHQTERARQIDDFGKNYNYGRRPSAPVVCTTTRNEQEEKETRMTCTTSLSRSSSTDFPTAALPATEAPPQGTFGQVSPKIPSFGMTADTVRETLSLKSKDGALNSQYQLGNCIGKGQFGSVYKALDLATGEIVAVKRIQIDEGGVVDSDVMKEINVLKTMSHTNVIQYLGYVRSKNHVNIVLEYAENGSLFSTLRAFGAFPEKLVASFCIKMLSGLEYLHANKVVHCDLKAANILTTKTGDVKLSDFGVSLNLKIKKEGTMKDGPISGTPNWMAPEVIELKGTTPKSDIWSLGCTLIELATGKPPYANLIPMSAMFRIVEDEYPPLPDHISEEMRDFLLKCFQKEPDRRPSASQLMTHKWIQKHNKNCPPKHDTYHSKETTAENTTEKLPENRPRKTSSARHPQISITPKDTEHVQSSVDVVQYPRVISVHHKQRVTLELDINNKFTIPSSHRHLQYSTTQTQQQQQQQQQQKQQQQQPQRRNQHMDKIQDTKTESKCDKSEPYENYNGAHYFTKMTPPKDTQCKVCSEVFLEEQVLKCEVCALVCHDKCRVSALLCPPKVGNQQPSYDWVFSAKIYNHKRCAAAKANGLAGPAAAAGNSSGLLDKAANICRTFIHR